jgi:hypothetical protein
MVLSVMPFAFPPDVARLVVVVVMGLDVLRGAAIFAGLRNQLAATNEHIRVRAAVGSLPRLIGELCVANSMFPHVLLATLTA